MILSQVINGMMLPFLLIFMMVIINDRRIMGEHVNGRIFNVIAWITIAAAIALTGRPAGAHRPRGSDAR